MGRRERRPQRRERRLAPRIGAIATKGLVVLLGLPPAVVGQATIWIEKALAQPVRVVSIAASPDDNNPYRNIQIATLLASVADFARRKLRAEQQPAPSSILLLYVPAADHEPLLSAFDFFAFPIPLARLGEFEDGKQLRHSSTEVRAAINRALVEGSPDRCAFEAVAARVKAVRDAEPLQLPPANFHTDKNTRIAALFRALRSGAKDWDADFEDLKVQEFDDTRIPRLPKDITRRAYQDARGLVFLRAHLLAHHGAGRQIAGEERNAKDLIDLLLRGKYRFGSAFDEGFHHDVQLEKGRSLRDLEFECARKGIAKFNDSYVNIYPNDVVRGKNLIAP